MQIKSSMLNASGKCSTKRLFDLPETESEKGNTYKRSVLLRKCIKYFSDHDYSISALKEYEEKIMEDLEFNFYSDAANIQGDTFMKQFLALFDRYFKAEKERGTFDNKYTFEAFPSSKLVKCFGVDVEVLPDMITFNNNKITIIKYKFGKPNISLNGSNEDTSASLSKELYAMIKYGRQLADDLELTGTLEIEAGYMYLTKKGDNLKYLDGKILPKDKKGNDIPALEPTFFTKTSSPFFSIKETIVDFGSSTMASVENLDERFSPLFANFVQGQDCKGTAACDTCGMKPWCYFKELPELDKSEKLVRSSKSLTFNKIQKAAISFRSGVARINACAGSGKTVVVASRNKVLIEEGVKPERILNITFTDAGAKEMKQRITAYCVESGIPAEEVKVKCTTFNAFAYDIIKKEYALLGYSEPPKVIDDVDKSMIIAGLLNNNPKIDGLDYANFEMCKFKALGAVALTRKIFDVIQSENITINASDTSIGLIRDKVGLKLEDKTIIEVMKLYNKYTDLCFKECLITFDDQERLLFEILKVDPSYLNRFHFEHIMVDEFQDSNDGQMRLIKKLMTIPDFKSLMVVGDDSQAIYGFRKTSPKNIINFFKLINETEKSFNIRKIDDNDMYDFYLTENYRSTKQIIEFANGINDININKVNKSLTPTQGSGVVPTATEFDTQEEEYDFISKSIIDKIKNGEKPNNICFIAATRNELLRMEELLNNAGIKTLLLNPEYQLENSRVQALISLARAIKDPLLTNDILIYLNALYNNELKNMAKADIETNLRKVQAKLNQMSNLSDKEKLEALKKLALAIAGEDEIYEDFYNKVFRKTTFEAVMLYIEAFSLYGQGVQVKRVENYIGAVLLTTAHSSKGLEWDIVYNSISKYHTQKLEDEEEEERRRLFFVSITRARKELYVTGQKCAYKYITDDGTAVPVSNVFLNNASNVLTHVVA